MIAHLLPVLMPLIERLIPDAAERQKLEREIEQAAAAGDAAQVGLNAREAEHPSLFVAGARPAALWLAVAGFGYAVIAQPLLVWLLQIVGLVTGWGQIPAPPALNAEAINALLFGLLGLGGLRTVEKIRDVAREGWPRAGKGGR